MAGSQFTDEGLGIIDRLVQDAVQQADAPGVVAAAACGDTVHVSIAGSMSIDGPPMRRDTLFRITSMTKPMTATAVLSMIEDGALGIDDPVEAFLPELADRRVLRRPSGPLDETVSAERAITVRDLLTFTWGFGMQGAMFEAAEPWPIFTATIERGLNTFGPPQPGLLPDPDRWLAGLGELPLIAQPGERWLYQTGSQVLGVLASRVAETSFEDVLRKRLFTPLSMDDTGFHARSSSRLATAYGTADGVLRVTDEPDGQWARPPAFQDGGAGLVSGVDDVIAFGRMLLAGGGSVLKPSTVAEMTRDQLTPAQRTNSWPGFSFLEGRGWGYGLSVLDDGRYGWEGGFGSSWSNIPSLDLTVVVLTQRAFDESGPPAVCAAVLEAARAAVAA